MKKAGAGNCVPLPMRLLYSAEEKFTGGKHDFKVQGQDGKHSCGGSGKQLHVGIPVCKGQYGTVKRR
jgi:hypothetical protein